MPTTGKRAAIYCGSCRHCSTAKRKCSGAEPACSRCLKANLPCVYDVSRRANRAAALAKRKEAARPPPLHASGVAGGLALGHREYRSLNAFFYAFGGHVPLLSSSRRATLARAYLAGQTPPKRELITARACGSTSAMVAEAREALIAALACLAMALGSLALCESRDHLTHVLRAHERSALALELLMVCETADTVATATAMASAAADSAAMAASNTARGAHVFSPKPCAGGKFAFPPGAGGTQAGSSSSSWATTSYPAAAGGSGKMTAWEKASQPAYGSSFADDLSKLKADDRLPGKAEALLCVFFVMEARYNVMTGDDAASELSSSNAMDTFVAAAPSLDVDTREQLLQGVRFVYCELLCKRGAAKQSDLGFLCQQVPTAHPSANRAAAIQDGTADDGRTQRDVARSITWLLYQSQEPATPQPSPSAGRTSSVSNAISAAASSAPPPPAAPPPLPVSRKRPPPNEWFYPVGSNLNQQEPARPPAAAAPPPPPAKRRGPPQNEWYFTHGSNLNEQQTTLPAAKPAKAKAAATKAAATKVAVAPAATGKSVAWTPSCSAASTAAAPSPRSSGAGASSYAASSMVAPFQKPQAPSHRPLMSPRELRALAQKRELAEWCFMAALRCLRDTGEGAINVYLAYIVLTGFNAKMPSDPYGFAAADMAMDCDAVQRVMVAVPGLWTAIPAAMAPPIGCNSHSNVNAAFSEAASAAAVAVATAKRQIGDVSSQPLTPFSYEAFVAAATRGLSSSSSSSSEDEGGGGSGGSGGGSGGSSGGSSTAGQADDWGFPANPALVSQYRRHLRRELV